MEFLHFGEIFLGAERATCIKFYFTYKHFGAAHGKAIVSNVELCFFLTFALRY